MLAATVLGVLFVPVFFVVVKRVFKDKPAKHAEPSLHGTEGQAAE